MRDLKHMRRHTDIPPWTRAQVIGLTAVMLMMLYISVDLFFRGITGG